MSQWYFRNLFNSNMETEQGMPRILPMPYHHKKVGCQKYFICNVYGFWPLYYNEKNQKRSCIFWWVEKAENKLFSLCIVS